MAFGKLSILILFLIGAQIPIPSYANSHKVLTVSITEVKVPADPAQAELIQKILELKPTPVKQTIYFFDTEDQFLYSQGIIIRARRDGTDAHEKYKIAVKLRPLEEVNLGELTDFKNAVFEYDLTPQGLTLAGALNQTLSPKVLEHLLRHQKEKTRTLLTPQQRKFIEARVYPDFPTKLDLSVHGPIESLRWDSKKWKLERWRLPNGVFVAEVSAKVPTQKAPALLKVLQEIFTSHQITIIPGGFKTKQALTAWAASDCLSMIHRLLLRP
ncbi:hypothetical protein WDW37_13520 [Bdellovibrionota bacterium FG-1]